MTVAEVPQRRQKIQSKTKQGNRRKVARDVRPKFRKARDTVEAKRSRVFLGKVITRKKKKEEAKELQRSFANCLRSRQ